MSLDPTQWCRHHDLRENDYVLVGWVRIDPKTGKWFVRQDIYRASSVEEGEPTEVPSLVGRSLFKRAEEYSKGLSCPRCTQKFRV